MYFIRLFISCNPLGALKSVLSGHPLGLSITEAQAREIELTFSSTHLVNPRSSQSSINNKFKFDYEDPLVTLKTAAGSNITFGIKGKKKWKKKEMNVKKVPLHELIIRIKLTYFDPG
jgi:hypothetical protein